MTQPPEVRSPLDLVAAGQDMQELMAELFPICRSITGDGLRQTFKILADYLPIEIHEVATGTQVFDWTVPREWNIRDAYVKDLSGRRVVDFHRSNLHVASYSVPVRARMPLADLKEHVFTLPEQPELIPYRTTYYAERWAFCMSERQLASLKDAEYEICIDSTLTDGSLTYAEAFLPGFGSDEVLISIHACHPSLANDNLSGVVLAAILGKYLTSLRLRYSYRFLFVPGTIGSITWLALNEEIAPRIRHGLVVACVGDGGAFTYKRSRQGDAEVDRAVALALRESGEPHELLDFSPFGYDERQYCSPGFDLPIGCLSRTPHGRFPQYHTSADDLDFVSPTELAKSLSMFLRVIDVLEGDGRFRSLNPKGEPQLGRRGLYPSVGGGNVGSEQLALLWVMNLSDGRHSLMDIAERSGLPFGAIHRASLELAAHDLLEPLSDKPQQS